MTRHEVAARIRARRGSGLVTRGDHELNEYWSADKELIEAAVLIPLIDRPEGLSVLLTLRTEHLSDHAGQISFPGGRRDPDDQDMIATALREAREEIGLQAEAIEVIGQLSTYITRTGFSVTPVVALIDANAATFHPDPFEVAEIFEVPLSFLLDPSSCRKESRMFAGQARFFYAFPWQHYHIWGATAGMLVNLVQELLGEEENHA